MKAQILVPLIISAIPVIVTLLSLIIRNTPMAATALSVDLLVGVICVWVFIWSILWNREHWKVAGDRHLMGGLSGAFFLCIILAVILSSVYQVDVLQIKGSKGHTKDNKNDTKRKLPLGIIATVFYFIAFLFLLWIFLLVKGHPKVED